MNVGIVEMAIVFADKVILRNEIYLLEILRQAIVLSEFLQQFTVHRKIEIVLIGKVAHIFQIIFYFDLTFVVLQTLFVVRTRMDHRMQNDLFAQSIRVCFNEFSRLVHNTDGPVQFVRQAIGNVVGGLRVIAIHLAEFHRVEHFLNDRYGQLIVPNAF